MSASKELRAIQKSLYADAKGRKKLGLFKRAEHHVLAVFSGKEGTGSKWQNENGLTLKRWLMAAGIPASEVRRHHITAFKRGEDPSDYRAER